jgi:hypothetical protein
MPQGPIQTLDYRDGTKTVNYVNSSQVIKTAAGLIASINVLVAGSGTGTINDAASTATATTANEVAVIPETVGPIALNFPCFTGITLVLGTGQIVSVCYR